nr:SMC family ATPase [Pyrinomonadaceae bacterium]
RNGAGKTTILEAIAWALFDALDYSKNDFLRRGAKKGWVRVSFLSDLDQRQYTIYRDTGNGYYVYDPALNAKLHEKKADVSAFLRQHLSIEPGTDMAALFKSAVGVPQGTLTSDFLKTKEQRKAAFDPLLKVEEYIKGAERLRDTIRLINERALEAHKRIANAEGQLARYDELTSEHEAAANRVSELTGTLAQLRHEATERERVTREMDAAERLANEAQAAAQRLAVERTAAAQRLSDLQNALAVAVRARERQQATAADFAAHLAAQKQLRALETERAEREKARDEANRAARLADMAGHELQRLTDALERAERARQSLVELEQEIGQQQELEKERERLRDLLAQARAAQARLQRIDRELEELRALHTQTKERVRAADKAQNAEQEVAGLESEKLENETRLSQAEKDFTSRRHLEKQREAQAREVERVRRSVTALEREIKQFSKDAAGAEQAPELEARERELSAQAARLRAAVEHDERIRAQAKNGLCPIMGERCTSFGEKQTLDNYFTEHATAGRAQLATLETESRRITEAVRRARDAVNAAAQLAREQTRIEAEGQLLAQHEERLVAVQAELAKLSGADKALLDQLQAQKLGIDGSLLSAREAAKRYAEIGPLRARLKEIEEEGKRKREERDELAAVAGAVESLSEATRDAEHRLRDLNDPRGRAAALQGEAARSDSLKPEVAAARAALAGRQQERLAREAELERFRELDAQWNTATAERERTAAAHQDHLASAALAETLPAREAEAQAATETATRAADAAEEARVSYDRAVASYDRERHQLERGQLALLQQDAAKTAAQLETARASVEKLAADIQRLDEVRAAWREEKLKEEHLRTLTETTDFVRDTLKKAGPLVTESYLYNISIEANQLFREITGEAGRALRWSKEYEILLEEGGYERPFVSLSGGEQIVAALSVRLALLKQLSDIRVAFFDEPTVNMDAERRDRLAQQIGQVRHFDQLFVISHDDTFEETVDHVITIEKDEGGGMRDEQEGTRAEG